MSHIRQGIYVASMINPMLLIVQGKPTLSWKMSQLTKTGYTKPPIAAPAAASPTAKALYFLKYCDRTARAGQKVNPFPIPRQTA